MKFEFKYVVPDGQLQSLREAVMPYLEAGPFCAGREGNTYTVRSIYFDTPRFDYYYEKVDGYKVRKKIRIRGYNQGKADDIVFLEIKRKLQEPIEKARKKITFEFMQQLMMRPENTAVTGAAAQDKINGSGGFLYHIYSQNLRPVVLVIYDREAYHDKFGGGLRITLDKNLRAVAFPKLDDLYREENSIGALPGKFIFEVKFRETFPFWLRPIVARFGMIRQAASKYVFCVDAHRLTDLVSPTGVIMISS